MGRDDARRPLTRPPSSGALYPGGRYSEEPAARFESRGDAAGI